MRASFFVEERKIMTAKVALKEYDEGGDRRRETQRPTTNPPYHIPADSKTPAQIR